MLLNIDKELVSSHTPAWSNPYTSVTFRFKMTTIEFQTESHCFLFQPPLCFRYNHDYCVFDSVERCKTCLSHCNHVAAKRYSFELKTDGFLRVELNIFGVTSLPVKVALDLSFLFLVKSSKHIVSNYWHSPTTSPATFHTDCFVIVLPFSVGFSPLLFCLASKMVMIPSLCLSPY